MPEVGMSIYLERISLPIHEAPIFIADLIIGLNSSGV
jgi:hypothetical protein